VIRDIVYLLAGSLIGIIRLVKLQNVFVPISSDRLPPKCKMLPDRYPFLFLVNVYGK
jgi:hypothetical protein